MAACRSTSMLLLAGGLAAAASATAQTNDGSLYRMMPSTIRQDTVQDGQLITGVAAHTLALQLWPVHGSSPAGYHHRMPARVGSAAPISLRVRALSPTDVALARTHPFEHPFKRVLTYWGCGEAGRDKQPRALRAENVSDDILSARLAPSPVDRDALRRVSEMAEATRLIASEDLRFPEELQLIGDHELRGGQVSLRFEVDQRGEFLPSPDISRAWVADDGSIRLHWRRDPAVRAYFLNMFVQKKLDPDVVIWTSSRTSEAGWLLSQGHPGGSHLERLRESGVLLGPDTETCIVPARATRHAGDALVIQLHAYAAELAPQSRRDSGVAAVSVRIASRSTTSVMVTDPRASASFRARTARAPR